MSDSKYVTREMYAPSDFVFLDAMPAYAVVIHKTASPGMSTAEAIAAYFQRGSDGRHVSSHYVVGKLGEIVQVVHEKDGAGANAGLPVEPGRDSLFRAAINWNLRTISVEHVDDSVDNSQPLTEVQKRASFNLVRDICRRKGISSSHVVDHRAIQPISKPRCAGNYPLDELRSFIDKGETMAPILNKNNEVCDVAAVSQFLPNKTEFACGFFTAAMVLNAGEPGKGPRGNAQNIEDWALNQYTKEYGANGANQVGGVSIDDMHRLLIAALPNSGASHYYDLPITANSGQASDMANIKGALNSGYAVACTVTEDSVIDKELNANPYFWGASGKHVFLITGVDANGDLIVHDQASIVGQLAGVNSPRPQPRHYDHKTINISWASMVHFPWLKPFPANWNPVTDMPLNQKEIVKPAPTPVQVPHVDYRNPFIVALWSRGVQPTPVRDTPIFNAWVERLYSGHTIGTVKSPQSDIIDDKGQDCEYQAFDGGICLRNKKDGTIRWI